MSCPHVYEVAVKATKRTIMPTTKRVIPMPIDKFANFLASMLNILAVTKSPRIMASRVSLDFNMAQIPVGQKQKRHANQAKKQ